MCLRSDGLKFPTAVMYKIIGYGHQRRIVGFRLIFIVVVFHAAAFVTVIRLVVVLLPVVLVVLDQFAPLCPLCDKISRVVIKLCPYHFLNCRRKLRELLEML